MGIMINRRRVCGGKTEGQSYVEIEYLESQGGCVIPTGVIPTGTNITIKTKIYYIGYTTNAPYIPWFMAYTNEQSSCYRIVKGGYWDNCKLLVNNSGKANGEGTYVQVNPNALYIIEMYPGYGFLNGTKFDLRSLATPVNTSEMIIFSEDFKGRFYSFYMADGDNILLDLIPVRKGQVGYMYDKVSKQLFGNAGTGSFILGQDI